LSKNTKIYLLLGVVLLIWGVIGFKVINTLSKDVPRPLPENPVAAMPIEIKKSDTFKLMANYRDPFLGTLSVAKQKIVKKKNTKKPTAIVKRNIAYLGLVTQKGSGSTMYFVTIEGQQHIMTENEEVHQVTLIEGNAKNIKVRYNGISETIPLSQ